MKVAIIMGSNSDWPILEPAEKTLKEFGVEVEVIVASAHRTPDVVHEFAAGARNRGVEAIIAAAGAAAHLGGVIAAYTTVPVIGIPINATPLNGMDALLSFVQMPAGIPVATMAINGAKNAALFAVQILSVKYPELVTKLAENRLQMQEEVTQKTIALVIKAAKLDANILKSAMRMYLNHCRKQAQKTHGKVSVKELVGEGAGASSIEITDGNIKSFERVARKYNVDFAVKKDKTTEPPKYLVFFKGRDADAVAQAFKEFVYGNEKKNSRTSVRQKLKHFRDVVSKDQNKERSREKNKDRGQSL